MNLSLFLVFAVWHIAKGSDTPELQRSCYAKQNVDDNKEISQSQIRFSLDLYKTIAKDKTGSVAVSPMDVFLLLTQLYIGTEGLSKQQLSNVLHYSSDRFSENAVADLSQNIYALRKYGALMNINIFQAYESGLNASFIDKIYSIFALSPLKAKSWDELTSGKAIADWAWIEAGVIYQPKFEGSESLVPATVASFVSGLKSNYKYRSRAKVAPFYHNDEDTYQSLPYWVNELYVIYGKLKIRRDSNRGYASAKYIGFDWDNRNGSRTDQNKIKTFMILPDTVDGINELEKNINEATINKMLSNHKSRWVNVMLPHEIKMKGEYNIASHLKDMNLTEIFKETDDFANMQTTRPMSVGPVYQGVTINHHLADPDREIPAYHKGFLVLINAFHQFAATHPFMIVNIFVDKNPFILTMGRYDLTRGESNAK